MENLEVMRSRLPEDDQSQAYQDALAQLRLWELVYQTRLFYDIDLDYDTAANKRYDIINMMHISREFPLLTARIKQTQDLLAHGLNVQIIDGEANLLLPPHACQATDKEAGGRFTRLLLGFRNHYFMPDSRFGWLEDFSQQPHSVR